jgi:hypothetical protein
VGIKNVVITVGMIMIKAGKYNEKKTWEKIMKAVIYTKYGPPDVLKLASGETVPGDKESGPVQ